MSHYKSKQGKCFQDDDDEIRLKDKILRDICECPAALFVEKYKKQLEQILKAQGQDGKSTKRRSIQSIVHRKKNVRKKSVRLASHTELARTSTSTIFKSQKLLDENTSSMHILLEEEDLAADAEDYMELFQADERTLITMQSTSGEEEGLFDQAYATERIYYDMFTFSSSTETDGVCQRLIVDEEKLTGEEEEEEKEHTIKIPRWTPMRQAQEYLRSRRIEDLFKFLGAHLLAVIPSDPVCYLIDLLEKCILYRDHNDEPPLLFSREHIESLFDSMDPLNYGSITVNQYSTAMLTLGIKNYEPYIKDDFVEKDIFVTDAYNYLLSQLDGMIGIPITPKMSRITVGKYG